MEMLYEKDMALLPPPAQPSLDPSALMAAVTRGKGKGEFLRQVEVAM